MVLLFDAIKRISAFIIIEGCLFSLCCLIVFLCQGEYDSDVTYLGWRCFENCTCPARFNITNTCVQNRGLGVDFARVIQLARISASSLSILGTIVILVRFAKRNVRNKFNGQLITTLVVFDFCFALKALQSNMPWFTTRPGSIGCKVLSYVHHIITMLTFGWKFVMMVNLILMVKWPSKHAQWSRGNKLYAGYIFLVLTLPLVVCVGSVVGDGMIDVNDGGAHCVLPPPWIYVEGYSLIFFFGCSVFTLFFIAQHLQMGLLKVSGTVHIRIMLQTLIFTVAFIGTWVWYTTAIFLPERTPNLLRSRVQLASSISFNLVGFTNSFVWFVLTRQPSTSTNEGLLDCEISSTAKQPSEVWSTVNITSLPPSTSGGGGCALHEGRV
jgi:hypothetical protein